MMNFRDIFDDFLGVVSFLKRTTKEQIKYQINIHTQVLIGLKCIHNFE